MSNTAQTPMLVLPLEQSGPVPRKSVDFAGQSQHFTAHKSTA